MAAFPPVVETRGVSKRYGPTEALRDVSVALSEQESRALVGRNGAGKSTLVAVLTGLVKPDAGEVWLRGTPAPDMGARERWREQIACVYQKSTVIPTLSVGENLFLNSHPGSRGRPGSGMVSWRSVRSQGRRLLAEWEIDIDVDAPAYDLTVGQRQLVEIARALRAGSRVIILDEPTARLEASEVNRLFDHMRRLRADGVAFLYISHHLDEIYEVCDTVTVLRDGNVVATAAVTEMPKDQIVDAMVGPVGALGRADNGGRVAAEGDQPRDTMPALSVRQLSVDGWCWDVSFDIAVGERVGLAGLGGCGKAQVADAIAGLVVPDGGKVVVAGRTLPRGRVDRAIGLGIGFLPGDRYARGLSPNLSTEENLTLSVLRHMGAAGLVYPRRRSRRAQKLISDLGIVASSPQQPIIELSGGNQQKATLGRALASEPTVLVLVSPTAGVDVASRRLLLETVERSSDVGVLVVSDDLDELAICDRVLVMFGGRIVREFGPSRHDNELVATMEGVEHETRQVRHG